MTSIPEAEGTLRRLGYLVFKPEDPLDYQQTLVVIDKLTNQGYEVIVPDKDTKMADKKDNDMAKSGVEWLVDKLDGFAERIIDELEESKRKIDDFEFEIPVSGTEDKYDLIELETIEKCVDFLRERGFTVESIEETDRRRHEESKREYEHSKLLKSQYKEIEKKAALKERTLIKNNAIVLNLHEGETECSELEVDGSWPSGFRKGDLLLALEIAKLHLLEVERDKDDQ